MANSKHGNIGNKHAAKDQKKSAYIHAAVLPEVHEKAKRLAKLPKHGSINNLIANLILAQPEPPETE